MSPCISGQVLQAGEQERRFEGRASREAFPRLNQGRGPSSSDTMASDIVGEPLPGPYRPTMQTSSGSRSARDQV